MMWNGGCCGGAMGFWMVLGVLIWFLLIAGGIWLLVWAFRRRTTTPPANSAPEDNAMTLLRERFARGEIEEAEYRERRHLLLNREEHGV